MLGIFIIVVMIFTQDATTTTTQEASGSYSTREEAEQAVTEAIDHLVEEGYTPTETEIIEVPAGSHTEEGEHISESEGHFETREEAETAMDERVSELEEQGYRIDDAEVSQTEEEHQQHLKHVKMLPIFKEEIENNKKAYYRYFIAPIEMDAYAISVYN